MSQQSGMPAPPVAERRSVRLETHGDVRIDDYFWLRERGDPAVSAYLQAENEYTQAVLRHTEPLQARLYQEMRSRVREDDISVPEQIDNYFYYHRMEAGKQYPIYCRRYQSMAAQEEILLDVNELAAGQAFTSIGNFKASPDHLLLAYAVDTSGDEVFTLHIKNLTTGELLPDSISNTYYGLEWANDSRTLFYTVLDEARRPYRLLRHRLGADPATDEVVFHEPDPAYNLTVRKSNSQAYILINLRSATSSEVWVAPADQPEAAPSVVETRRPNVEYSITHHEDRFFITTNDEAQNFRLMTAPVSAPGRAHWQEFIPHRPAVLLQGTDAFRRHLVVYEREAGLRHLRVINLATAEDYRVALPDPIYAISRSENPVFDTHLLRFTYESPVAPESVFDLDMDRRTLHLRKRQEVPGYDPSQYRTVRLWATAPGPGSAPEGGPVLIPISLVHHKDLALDGRNPALLYGYGAYGASLDPYFDANRISLLDRGFVWALAHIRGGSELGRSWYEQGKLLHKKNTFTDFIACAEHLIALGYTSPHKLVIHGRSAGGLLMGAVTNMRPDLFAGVVAGVPFVDVINTMLDPSIPLTAQEFEEWGDPGDEVYYAYMRSYSPYDNIADQTYPRLLATAGLNDARVQYWEPAKWVAKLRTMQHNSNCVLLKTNMAAGHSGASGRYDYLHEVAFEYAFILDVVGLAGD
jgi:oligopeptidase B